MNIVIRAILFASLLGVSAWAESVAATAPESEQKQDSEVSSEPKKPRGKIFVADYFARKEAERDSIIAVNYRHGVTFAGARYNESYFGDYHEEPKWSGGLGFYYFYRRYFIDVIGLQGRFGVIYRYGRYNFDRSESSGKLKSGNSYALTRDVELTYNNLSFDLPLTFKVGFHIEPTTFLFFSGTFGVTKPMFEKVYIKSLLSIDKSKLTKSEKSDIETLERAGLSGFPLYESKDIEKNFFMDDWETNGWLGLGIDGKYLSAAFEVQVASGASTDDNHRYHHLFHDSEFTWRFMVDFSMR